MTLKAYREPTMIWNISLANGGIINAVVRDAKLSLLMQSFGVQFNWLPQLQLNFNHILLVMSASVSRSAWQLLRVQLQQHQHKRVQQRHFRRSPATYLASLEQQLLQLTLPS